MPHLLTGDVFTLRRLTGDVFSFSVGFLRVFKKKPEETHGVFRFFKKNPKKPTANLKTSLNEPRAPKSTTPPLGALGVDLGALGSSLRDVFRFAVGFFGFF